MSLISNGNQPACDINVLRNLNRDSEALSEASGDMPKMSEQSWRVSEHVGIYVGKIMNKS